jgi:hypothetical protein
MNGVEQELRLLFFVNPRLITPPAADPKYD